MDYLTTKERYRKHRLHARELLEEELLHAFQRRIKVVAIDDDVVREARREWYDKPGRRVQWDWDTGIVAPGRRSSARYFDFALIDGGSLCVLAAARVSHKKRWLSLTHVEGAPWEHPLKGRVLPVVIRSLYIYRGVICATQVGVQSTGVRILNPLPDALECYSRHGYTLQQSTKWHRAIDIEAPFFPLAQGPNNASKAQASSAAPAQDGTGGTR
jgi:hypothetical protein